jgi:hypothetical protein
VVSTALLIPPDHPIQWVTASPLWDSVLPRDSRKRAVDEQPMQRPALLRFASDSFMDDLARLLDSDPAKLEQHRALPETHRILPPGRSAPATAPPLKLFQAAHGHFNLVAATLVCRRPGLPEHLCDPARAEKVGFLLRRLDAAGKELAWVPGATPVDNAWKTPADPALVVEGEEILPLFPITFTHADRVRRLFVGLVPTSSSAGFRNTGPLSISATSADRGGAPAPDPRAEDLKVKVTRALAQIQDTSVSAENKPEASRFLLVDLGGWLHDNLGSDGDAILAGTRPAGAKAAALWDGSLRRLADPDRHLTWAQVLSRAWQLRDAIWGEQGDASSFVVDLTKSTPGAGAFADALVASLPPMPAKLPPRPDGEPGPDEVPIPKLDLRGQARYVVRCVYQRPACGALHDDVVSVPSERFQIANFFDLDAPARPIQITLPIDTSMADLRKVRTSVRFLLSDELRKQMAKASDMNALLNKQTGADDGPNIGMICSFSIPIITICALILLMIIVGLLNIIFWWVPFFRICFPIGLKAKSP